MSRYTILLEKFTEGEETAAEAEELAWMIRHDPDGGAALYDGLMLEADLYDLHAGIAPVQVSIRRPDRIRPRLAVAWAIAVFLLVGVAVILLLGRPSSPSVPQYLPTAPPPPPPKGGEPSKPERGSGNQYPPDRESKREREHEDHGSKKDEIEREYLKGLKEVERKRLEGQSAEADKKLREIERERDKHLRELDRRRDDR
jgi:hypothetical protein